MNRSEIRPQWQSLEELDSIETQSKVLGQPADEFAPGADTLEVRSGVDRRNFLGLMGASMALTGTVATGCIRKPDEKILAYVKRPEDLIPGESRFFATNFSFFFEVARQFHFFCGPNNNSTDSLIGKFGQVSDIL